MTSVANESRLVESAWNIPAVVSNPARISASRVSEYSKALAGLVALWLALRLMREWRVPKVRQLSLEAGIKGALILWAPQHRLLG